ncbi:hypothetical protein [Blastopirellula marina]|uniref:Uncharacterized protein n=1 Tax=Blastopirellula marina TaxID=124 RepID=A0A2S8GBV3_9BACT|nr:hypothetical protein [Blastopirellula marina]PQO41903.1 hypothetical protein C5Y98_02375 [Blastopirellula marina]PTL46261.1 hypothetical protein C5Y97_02375 [Blastopirellula marina]
MRQITLLSHLLLAGVVTVGLTGCGGAPKTDDHDVSEQGHDHDHGHPSEGPHHGALIELGNEEYHAELVHDDEAGTVTIYLLDAAAKEPVAIDAADITVNITHDGEGAQFKLTADGAVDGKATKFISSETALAEALDEEGADTQLVVAIEGKQFRGYFTHDHDHETHDHDH